MRAVGAPGGAQSVKRLIPDFGSDHDLVVCEFGPTMGLWADSVEPASDAFSPSLSLPLPPPNK